MISFLFSKVISIIIFGYPKFFQWKKIFFFIIMIEYYFYHHKLQMLDSLSIKIEKYYFSQQITIEVMLRIKMHFFMYFPSRVIPCEITHSKNANNHQNLPISQNTSQGPSLIFWRSQDECTLVHTLKFQVRLNYTTSSNLKKAQNGKILIKLKWRVILFLFYTIFNAVYL